MIDDRESLELEGSSKRSLGFDSDREGLPGMAGERGLNVKHAMHAVTHTGCIRVSTDIRFWAEPKP